MVVKLISAGLPLLLCFLHQAFVWLMSECDTLSIVQLSEPHTPEAGFTEEKGTHVTCVLSSNKQ